MKWGIRAFLKIFFYEIAMARRSTSSNVEALRLVLEQHFIPIVDTSAAQTANLLGRRSKAPLSINPEQNPGFRPGKVEGLTVTMMDSV
jgi:hypothetical protein